MSRVFAPIWLVTISIVTMSACRPREIVTSLEDSDLNAANNVARAEDERAAWQKIASKEFTLPAPPVENSKAYKRDFKILHEQQAARSDADCQLANSQLHAKFSLFFGTESKQLTEDEYAQVEALMTKVNSFTERVTGYFKGLHQRSRPYDVDTQLEPCIPKPGGSRSYPSSHAAIATADACLLAKIFPKKAKKLKAYGTYLGNLRYVVGVHHPSDVTAGQTLGDAICKRLWDESSFQDALNSH